MPGVALRREGYEGCVKRPLTEESNVQLAMKIGLPYSGKLGDLRTRAEFGHKSGICFGAEWIHEMSSAVAEACSCLTARS